MKAHEEKIRIRDPSDGEAIIRVLRNHASDATQPPHQILYDMVVAGILDRCTVEEIQPSALVAGFWKQLERITENNKELGWLHKIARKNFNELS